MLNSYINRMRPETGDTILSKNIGSPLTPFNTLIGSQRALTNKRTKMPDLYSLKEPNLYNRNDYVLMNGKIMPRFDIIVSNQPKNTAEKIKMQQYLSNSNEVDLSLEQQQELRNQREINQFLNSSGKFSDDQRYSNILDKIKANSTLTKDEQDFKIKYENLPKNQPLSASLANSGLSQADLSQIINNLKTNNFAAIDKRINDLSTSVGNVNTKLESIQNTIINVAQASGNISQQQASDMEFVNKAMVLNTEILEFSSKVSRGEITDPDSIKQYIEAFNNDLATFPITKVLDSKVKDEIEKGIYQSKQIIANLSAITAPEKELVELIIESSAPKVETTSGFEGEAVKGTPIVQAEPGPSGPPSNAFLPINNIDFDYKNNKSDYNPSSSADVAKEIWNYRKKISLRDLYVKFDKLTIHNSDYDYLVKNYNLGYKYVVYLDKIYSIVSISQINEDDVYFEKDIKERQYMLTFNRIIETKNGEASYSSFLLKDSYNILKPIDMEYGGSNSDFSFKYTDMSTDPRYIDLIPILKGHIHESGSAYAIETRFMLYKIKWEVKKFNNGKKIDIFENI